MSTKDYRAFIGAVRVERGNVCQACGRTAEEAREKKLACHHLWPVAASGIADALVTSRANVLLLCGYCHKLQHPGLRFYPWGTAGALRGIALRG